MSPQSSFQGACQPWEEGSRVWKFERNGKWDFVSNVLHSQGPGKRGGGCSAWARANIVSVPKRWVLGTTPLIGRSVGKSKPGCSLLLCQQRQRDDVPAETFANLYKWSILYTKNKKNRRSFNITNAKSGVEVWCTTAGPQGQVPSFWKSSLLGLRTTFLLNASVVTIIMQILTIWQFNNLIKFNET